MKARDIHRTDKNPPKDAETSSFDPAKTDQLEALRVSVVSTIEGGSSGAIDYDDRGQARWKWKTESTPAGDVERTFDLLKALNTDALSIEDSDTPAAEPAGKPPRRSGYNPYDVGGPAKRKPGK